MTALWVGPFSVFHKASVIGLRLKEAVGATCILLGLYILLIKH